MGGLNVTCASCAFFCPPNDERGTTRGQCRRRSPVPILIDGNIRSRWPLVMHNNWCGDHAVVTEQADG